MYAPKNACISYSLLAGLSGCNYAGGVTTNMAPLRTETYAGCGMAWKGVFSPVHLLESKSTSATISVGLRHGCCVESIDR